MTDRELMQQALDALEHEAQKGNDDAYRVERDALCAAIEQAQEPRQWQGLTDEEISKLIDNEIGFNSCWGPEEQFARAVEAKLKEKNT